MCFFFRLAETSITIKRLNYFHYSWFERMTLSLTFGIWEYQDQQDIPVEKQASVVL
jgi:hypothetical protein